MNATNDSDYHSQQLENATLSSPPVTPLTTRNIVEFIDLVLQSTTLVTTGVAAIANAVVCITLCYVILSTSSPVNVLIANQVAIDLCASLVSFASYYLRLTGRFNYQDGATTENQILCLLMDSFSLPTVFACGSTFGLIIITVERYFKIVHPVQHMKRYRRWMTYVGVLFPWMIGVLGYAVPMLSTSRIVNGVCMLTAFWPHPNMAKVIIS